MKQKDDQIRSLMLEIGGLNNKYGLFTYLNILIFETLKYFLLLVIHLA